MAVRGQRRHIKQEGQGRNTTWEGCVKNGVHPSGEEGQAPLRGPGTGVIGVGGAGTRAGTIRRLWGSQERNHVLPIFHGVERLQLVPITVQHS